MGDYAVNNFYNYVNILVYSQNFTVLAAIRMYLVDNNIPLQNKQMNCIYDMVNTIANRYTNEMNIFNNNNNNQVIPNELIYTLTQLQEVQNLLTYNNINH